MESADPFFSLNLHEDARGKLVAIEGSRDIPFAIERVYYIIGAEGAARGFHAHRSLEQLMICLSGSCRIVLDDGRRRSDYRLDRPDTGLFVRAMTWREMHDFSPNCVILVLASAHYDEADYVWDHDEFLKLAGGRK
jgi:dTDP-4-dehydrorhamnose 3,5-epimerase-like enzyme